MAEDRLSAFDPGQPFDPFRSGRSRIKLASVYGELRQRRERAVPLRSLDHLVRSPQQRRRNRQPQRLRRLHVDDQLELGRLLDGQVRRLRALENLVDEDDVKASFERFVTAQNAHDANAVRDLLLDSPNFLWITRGTTIWGRDVAMKRFETYYQGTWRLSPDSSSLKILMLGDIAAQLYAAIMFTTGAPGQPPQDGLTLMNQTWVKTPAGWRVASILPIPVPPPAPAK